MDITNRIGEYDFWGMLIPGCAAIWAVRMIPSVGEMWQKLSCMSNETFKWTAFLAISYVSGLAISAFMDWTWYKLKLRNNPKHIVKTFQLLQKDSKGLYPPVRLTALRKDPLKEYYNMYNQMIEAYRRNPISILEQQTALLRNMTIPSFMLVCCSAFKIYPDNCFMLILGTVFGVIAGGLFCALTLCRQKKTYMVVLEYHASIEQLETSNTSTSNNH